MPLYEYECEACRQRFERIQKFSDPPIETCPACSGKVQKLLSSPAIQFKGSGWYITDYAKKGSGERPKAEADKAAKPESKDAKGESASGTTSAEPSTSAPATDPHGPARTR
ncbi:MAG TPA: FmdB family zinc ribbon protein [Vicinamibacterales bacterium]|nr:FmdB family zinc ribbon protein [Vicinamibacterales bacterium]